MFCVISEYVCRNKYATQCIAFSVSDTIHLNLDSAAWHARVAVRLSLIC